jgi:hypothetical protein
VAGVGGLLHKLRDALLLAAAEIERGDDTAAAETIEKAARDIRKEIEAK